MFALRQLIIRGYTPCTFDYGCGYWVRVSLRVSLLTVFPFSPRGTLLSVFVRYHEPTTLITILCLRTCRLPPNGGQNSSPVRSLDDGVPSLADWIEVFRKSIPTFKSHALTDPNVAADSRKEAAEKFERDFNAALDALRDHPAVPAPGHPDCHPVNCLTLCKMREECLYAAGFRDIFSVVKAEEGDRALELLPRVVGELDQQEGGFPAELELALRGVFAGNIFDLGASASAELHAAGGGSFAATRSQLLPRPWAVDDLDELLAAVRDGRRWLQAALFVDNAGPDVVLGMLPLARVLVKAGTKVLLMANRGPTINDITAAELEPLLRRAALLDPVLGAAVDSGSLRVVCSGSDLPVIDLTQLSQEAVDETAECDLIVLEGMGRAIETNLKARFTCDSLKLGMIKHPEVARHFNNRLYDCVCKFDRAEQSGRTREP